MDKVNHESSCELLYAKGGELENYSPEDGSQ